MNQENTKDRWHYSKEKVKILRKHLLEARPIS